MRQGDSSASESSPSTDPDAAERDRLLDGLRRLQRLPDQTPEVRALVAELLPEVAAGAPPRPLETRPGGPADASAGFAAAASAWVASRASPETRKAYARDVGLWLRWCAGRGEDPGAPLPGSAAAFRDELVASRAPLTVRRVLACLSGAWQEARPGARDPFSSRALPRPPASDFAATAAAPDADARAAVAAAASRGEAPLRDAALVQLLWSTGLRRASAAGARRRDLAPLPGGGATLRVTLKGGRLHEAELDAAAAAAAAAWLEAAPPSQWLFPRLDDPSRPLTPSGAGRVVAAAARAAGVRLAPHMMRAAFVTRALDAGVRLERVQAAAGHRDPRSTLRYDRGRRGAGVSAELAAFRSQEVKP